MLKIPSIVPKLNYNKSWFEAYTRDNKKMKTS
jgi:hypothetical protein